MTEEEALLEVGAAFELEAAPVRVECIEYIPGQWSVRMLTATDAWWGLWEVESCTVGFSYTGALRAYREMLERRLRLTVQYLRNVNATLAGGRVPALNEETERRDALAHRMEACLARVERGLKVTEEAPRTFSLEDLLNC